MKSAAALLFALASARAAETPAMPLNYWTVDGDRMVFESAELHVAARLPLGFESLRVLGHEFLAAGPECGGLTFRKPDGSFVTRYTDLGNTSHDAMQGRKGSVSDGLYLLSVTTGWMLPRFEIYAGFNDTNRHDLILFFGDGVCALRAATPGGSLATARQIVKRGDKAGTSLAAGSFAVVHDSGVVLRVGSPDSADRLTATVFSLPDGKTRLALAIPCKGMAANTVPCQYDVHNGGDALAVFPDFRVASPAMGKGDSGYKPQSNGHWTLYEKDAQLDYIFSFGWLSSQPFRGKVVVEARHALGKPHLRIEAMPEQTGAKDGAAEYRAVLHPKFSMPGVSEVNVHLLDDGGVVLMTDRLRILYDWPSYRPVFNAPPDLREFWDRTLAELQKVPLEPKVDESLFRDDPDWTFEHVSFNGWQGKRIHACVYIPKAAGRPLPVKLTAHPGTLGFGANHRADGVYGSKVKADARFVTIVPLIRGYPPDAKDVPFNQPWWGPLDNRDDYAARSWYCALVRALDYLATRPDLADMKRVVAAGGSQGGALALAAAALDPRVKLCLADCPSNCMLNDSVRPGTYATFGPTSGQVPKGQTLDDLLRTLSYYDPANLAPRIACPTVIHLNVGDLTVHAMGGLGAFKNLTSLPPEKRWFFPGVNGNFHSGSRDGGLKADELTEKVLAGAL